MKNIRIKLIIVCTLLAALLCLVLTACGNPVAEIYVDKSGMPSQTSFIQGQDLSLKGGVLTVVAEDGSTSIIPLDNPEITATGYDKDTLGKQSVTITYQDKTTTIEVNVIARIVAENYETNYFVGDNFNKTKGKLKITRDNMSAFSVNMNDPAVEIVFNSSKAGKSDVAVKYTAQDGTVYEGSFGVNIYEVADIDFVTPTKKVYSSHESFDVTGGYFIVKAGGGSSFTVYVNITEDMYKGYNTSDVTEENLETPDHQEIVFTYGGESFTMNVEVYYSGVYVIQNAAKELGGIDWSDKEFKLSDENGEIAYNAILQYYKLKDADKALISEEDLHNVVRPAAIYVNNLYLKEFSRISDAIIPTASGVSIPGKSYNAVVEAIDVLEDEDDALNVHANLLRNIVADFGDVSFTDEAKISNAVYVFSETYQGYIVVALEYLVELYDSMAAFPDDWDLDVIRANEDMIKDAATRIQVSEFKGYSYNSFYNIVSSWRANDDFIEIIYTYYFHVMEGGKEKLTEGEVWKDIPFPGVLADWYLAVSNAAVEAVNMKNNGKDYYLRDVTNFMFYYNNCLELMEEIKADKESIYYEVYAYMGCEALFYNDVRNAEYGYLYHMGSALESESLISLWDEYMAIINAISFDGATIEDLAEDLEALFELVTDLTPEELHDFISSLHFLYRTSEGNVLAFTIEEGVYSNFTYVLATYYAELLGEEVFEIFCDLLIAMENYSLIEYKDTARDDFIALMEKIDDAISGLSDEDEVKFVEYLSDAYGKCNELYLFETEEVIPSKGELAPIFDELYEIISRYDEIYALLIAEDCTAEFRNAAIPVLFALYEKADVLYNTIKASDSKLALETLEAENGESYDYMHNRFKNYIVNFMINTFLTLKDGEEEKAYRVYDIYNAAEIQSFLSAAAYVMNAGLEDGELPSSEVIASALTALRELTNEGKVVTIDIGALAVFFNGIQKYYSESAPESEEAASKALACEYAYLTYLYKTTDENLASFTEKMEALVDYYESLEDKSSFDEILKASYDYHLEKYNELKAE